MTVGAAVEAVRKMEGQRGDADVSILRTVDLAWVSESRMVRKASRKVVVAMRASSSVAKERVQVDSELETRAC